MIGLALLALNPASVVSNTFQMALAFLAAVTYQLSCAGFRPLLRVPRQFTLAASNARLGFVLLMLYAALCSLWSLGVLVGNDEQPLVSVVQRSVSQMVSLVLAFWTLTCSFQMAIHCTETQIRKVLHGSFWLMLAVCAYQSIALPLGLPFIGKYVLDKYVGLRPSGLALEPKFLASYLICLAFFIWQDDSFGPRLRMKSLLYRGTGVCGAAYFFVGAASANGFIGLLLLMLTHYLIRPTWPKTLMAAIAALGVAFVFGQVDLEEFGLRATHKDLLENISAIDLALLDDLIALPMMAWRDNPLPTILGYGPGLMHFFAHRYMDFATWLTDETYIEGNLSVIMYISNFGLIAFSVIFLYFLYHGRRIARASTGRSDHALHVFFLNAFVLGALVSGNVSIPFFIALGWILKARVDAGHTSAGRIRHLPTPAAQPEAAAGA